MSKPRYRIGIDVGGTFTDFVLADVVGRTLMFHKEPSVPSDPSLAVERGIASLLATHAIAAQDVELIVHGTTIGLNAIIQRRGARMALVVSKGNRDLLEIARLRLPSSYDFTEPREVPLVPRNLVFEISSRMKSDGTLLAPVDPAEIEDLAARLTAAKVDAVAIVLLNAYRSASLEIAVAEALRQRLPDVLVTESGVIWPEVREYERGLVAGLNAYIHPLMTRYFDRLKQRVSDKGVAAPIYITANNGGTLSLETARARPIDTVLSGPASGVVASTRVGTAAGRKELVTFDMGGTSADIAVCQTGVPEFTTATFVGDFPLMMPVVNVGAIGAGGGSIVWVDAQGFLKIGPLSAGADPGPVCYRLGGVEPTLTDCYVVLGIIDPNTFLGGRMVLDADAAWQALERIADKLGLAGAERAVAAAEAAVRVASAKMATEITKLLATAGVDPRAFALMAYGGAGPTHANLLAEEAGLTAVMVPIAPGTFCALGAILADVRRDYVRTARHLISSVPDAATQWMALTTALEGLERQARAWIAKEGSIIGDSGIVVSFNMRYHAQAYEIEIIVPAALQPGLDAAGLCALFHREHERLYGFSEPTVPIETTTIRLGVIGRVAPVALPEVPARHATPVGHRTIWREGRQVTAAVYARADVGAGAVIPGPAIVEQLDTTTFVLPGWRAEADSIGTLHLTRATPATETQS
ncbi:MULTISPECIES: hydantoinase/oxoprolinase family protein [unclassified Chelatococcus]|uniref:hydantoinase/oxoprolinase family protein n=2 Tax=Chelatococcus TaxID=28209 RepID=UPI001BCCF572|nr:MULTISPECIES: hydantoinase/oxoprolinase family protein [unclassified Chelatococcus]MBS7742760.1 hydantoinase/oxoprolinase family protein [Chelatococcus sp. HY11]MBX3542122.1 hydantoinase/oxoprolinase family protein [Chelatococcus sp.]MCO5075663.1 hydantoinase/oxoprolinase family protein [Chelatococcus sp.]